MNLKDLFNAGLPVAGSPLDGTIKPLGDMSIASQARHGYLDSNGYWTDKGYERATTRDFDKLDAGFRAMQAFLSSRGR